MQKKVQTASGLAKKVLTEIKEPSTRERAINTHLSESNKLWRNGVLRTLDFQTFGDEKLEEMLNETVRFIYDMEAWSEPRWLSLLGPSYIGKTYLTKGVWKRFNAVTRFNTRMINNRVTGGTAMYESWRQLSRSLRERQYGIYEDAMKDFFVVIDDIGATQDKSGYLTDQLDALIDQRIGRWTLLTSNLSVQQISDNLDSRISSRLIRGKNVVVQAEAKATPFHHR